MPQRGEHQQTEENGMETAEFDHTDPSMANGIYDWVAERRTTCPVVHSSKFGGFWAAFNYQEVLAGAHEASRFSSAGELDIPNIGTAIKSYPLQADPPEHAKYRRLLQPHFTPAAVAKFAPAVREIVVDRLEAIAPKGHAEVVTELAQPIPSIAIALILGIGRERWRDLQDWTKGMLEATIAGDPDGAKASGQKLFDFIVAEIGARKREPDHDLLTVITQATVDGDDIADEVRWGMAQVLMIAGHETTVNATANLVHHLATRPALRHQVATDHVMRAKVITESLRFESPVFGLARTVVEDTQLGGAALAKDDRLLVCFAAANRDPSRFVDPDTFDPEREDNGRHVAFGFGRHRCIGEHLAKMELDIIIEEFLRRVPDYRLRPGAPVEMRLATVRGPKSLEIVWDAAEQKEQIALA
jgi:cytochrome P450